MFRCTPFPSLLTPQNQDRCTTDQQREKTRVTFYSLLFLDSGGYSPNIKSRDKAIITYIKMAILLAKSAAAAGLDFVLITNKPDTVLGLSASLGCEKLSVMEIPFSLEIPQSIPHRSAHHKIDVIKAAACGQLGDVIGIVDIDAIFTSPLPDIRVDDRSFLVYDITEQMISESCGKCKVDLNFLASKAMNEAHSKWFGGEFLVGTTESFKRLADAIDQLYPAYIENIRRFHHIGDEMIVSTALNLLAEDCLTLIDQGTCGNCCRFWTASRPFKQRRFRDSKCSFFLHMPADKEFLSKQAHLPFVLSAFLSSYESYASKKLFVRRIAGLLRRKSGIARPSHVARI